MNGRIRTIGATLCAILAPIATAQEAVRFPATDANGGAIEAAAVLRLPPGPVAGRKLAAVVLLHSKGGWESPVTEQYAKALAEAGIATLELRMFADPASAPPVPPTLLPMLFETLAYLAARDDIDAQRIGVAGFSYGGSMALHAAASWAPAAYAKAPGQKFAAHAPFYPVCWAFSAFAQGQRKTPPLPPDAFTRWTGAPVRIFAGGRDDYDDRDPGACADFVAQVPAAFRSGFSVQVYPEATHGWDQKSASFQERAACKGRGCVNTNEANPQITRQSIADLVAFFRETLAVRPAQTPR